MSNVVEIEKFRGGRNTGLSGMKSFSFWCSLDYKWFHQIARTEEDARLQIALGEWSGGKVVASHLELREVSDVLPEPKYITPLTEEMRLRFEGCLLGAKELWDSPAKERNKLTMEDFQFSVGGKWFIYTSTDFSDTYRAAFGLNDKLGKKERNKILKGWVGLVEVAEIDETDPRRMVKKGREVSIQYPFYDTTNRNCFRRCEWTKIASIFDEDLETSGYWCG